MKEEIDRETVIAYYKAARFYGLEDLVNPTKQWLVTNLLAYEYANFSLLKDMTPEIMSDILSSPDLVVFQYEFHIYDLLRDW